MSDFHSTPQWQKLAKEHKALQCIDCHSTNDIQSGHILPASRFPIARLWKSNLVHQCKPCNLKLGSDIRWSIQAIKLLVIYGAMKILRGFFALIGVAVMLIITATLIAYIYYDVTMSASTITNHIHANAIDMLRSIKTT